MASTLTVVHISPHLHEASRKVAGRWCLPEVGSAMRGYTETLVASDLAPWSEPTAIPPAVPGKDAQSTPAGQPDATADQRKRPRSAAPITARQHAADALCLLRMQAPLAAKSARPVRACTVHPVAAAKCSKPAPPLPPLHASTDRDDSARIRHTKRPRTRAFGPLADGPITHHPNAPTECKQPAKQVDSTPPAKRARTANVSTAALSELAAALEGRQRAAADPTPPPPSPPLNPGPVGGDDAPTERARPRKGRAARASKASKAAAKRVAAASTASDFEAQRLARIRENAKKLQQLGVMAAVSRLNSTLAAAPPKRQQARPAMPRPAPRTPLAPRRSTRLDEHGRPRNVDQADLGPAYDDPDDRDYGSAGRRRFLECGSAGKARAQAVADGNVRLSGACRVEHGYPAGCTSTRAAVEAAHAAALAKEAELRASAASAGRAPLVLCKFMNISHVSGGFYLQVDASLSRAVAAELGIADWGPNTGTGKGSPFYMDLRLTCSHGSRFSKPYAWKSTWLPKGNAKAPRITGVGLSGGWRSFAIDQRLQDCDSVVFEIQLAGESSTPAERLADCSFTAYIYRAKDYEEAENMGDKDEDRPVVNAPDSDEDDVNDDDDGRMPYYALYLY